MQVKGPIQAKPGDVVVVHGHTTGDPGRTGVIMEVLGSGEWQTTVVGPFDEGAFDQDAA